MTSSSKFFLFFPFVEYIKIFVHIIISIECLFIIYQVLQQILIRFIFQFFFLTYMYCPSQIFHMAYVCFQQRAYQAPSSGISIYIQKNIINHLQLQLPNAQLNVLPAHIHSRQ